MTLSSFTLNDRQRIVNVLELSARELEEYSTLYEALDETEERDERLGTNLVQQVRDTLDALELISISLSNLRTNADGQGGAIGNRTVNIVGEYVETVSDSGGLILVDGLQVPAGSQYSALLQQQAKLKTKLHRILDLYRKQERYPQNYHRSTDNGLLLG